MSAVPHTPIAPSNNRRRRPSPPMTPPTEEKKETIETHRATEMDNFDLIISKRYYTTGPSITRLRYFLIPRDMAEDEFGDEYAVLQYRRSKKTDYAVAAEALVLLIIEGITRENTRYYVEIVPELIKKYLWRGLFHFKYTIFGGMHPSARFSDQDELFSSDESLFDKVQKADHAEYVRKYGEDYIMRMDMIEKMEAREELINEGYYDDDYYD